MDDLSKKKPQDSSKVNIHEEYEVDYWCKTFNCTKLQLKKAVDEVGVSKDKIKKYLSNH